MPSEDHLPTESSRAGRWVCALALVALPLLFYHKFLLGQAFVWQDALFQFYPQQNYLAKSILDGRFPLWISGICGGMPFYSDVQVGIFYPLNWLLVPFAGSGRLPVLAYQWHHTLHVVLGMIFLYLFLREERLHRPACVLGALVFGFSGFITMHVVDFPMVGVVIWLPLELLFVKRAVTRGRPLDHLGLIAAILLSFLPGSPQITLYTSYLVLAYWFYCSWTNRTEQAPLRRMSLALARIVAVFGTVLLLGAVFLLPGAENWYHSQRLGLGFAEKADQSMPAYYLVQFLVPNFFGTVDPVTRTSGFWGFNENTLDFQRTRTASQQYWLWAAYAGQVALAAVCILVFNLKRIAQRREVAFFLCAALCAAWFMLGKFGGLYTVLYHVLPGVSLFRVPARVSCVLGLCLGVLAAHLAHSLSSRQALDLKRPVAAIFGAYVLLFAGLAVLGVWMDPATRGSGHWTDAFKQSLVCLALFGSMAFGLVLLRDVTGRLRAWVWGALLALTFIDFWFAYGHFQNGRDDPAHFYGDVNGFDPMFARYREQLGPFRYASLRDGKHVEESVIPNAMPYFYDHIESTSGYVLYLLRDVAQLATLENSEARFDLLNVKLLIKDESDSKQGEILIRSNALNRVEFYTRVKTYRDASQIFRDMDAGAFDHRMELAVLERDAGRIPPGPGSVAAREGTNAFTFTHPNPETYRIRYTVSSPGVFFVSEPFYPGWIVEGNGSAVIKTFGAFLGVVVPEPGAGEIVLRFNPPVLKIGAMISAATIVFVGVCCRIRRR